MNKPYLILGGGGHASVLLESLSILNQNVLGVISPDSLSSRKIFEGFTWYQSDEEVGRIYRPDTVQIINGIGPLPKSDLRARLQFAYEKKGFQFAGVISPTASVSKYADCDTSVQIMRAATVQVGAKLGKSSVVNTGAVIEHDCQLAEFCHVAPGAVLCGGVALENNVYVGANATILPGVRVGAGAIVGAGAVVTCDVLSDTVVYPARCHTKNIMNKI